MARVTSLTPRIRTPNAPRVAGVTGPGDTPGARVGPAGVRSGSAGSASQLGSAQSGGSSRGMVRAQTRVWYSPVRVSIRIVSPGSTKIGTWTTRPVSVVAGFRAPDCVSPAQPGAVSVTVRSTVTGSSTPIVSPW